MKNEGTIEGLRLILVDTLGGDCLDGEILKLKAAAQHPNGYETGDRPGGAALLSQAGLLKFVGTSENLGSTDYYWKLTEEGRRIYEQLNEEVNEDNS